MLIKVSHDDRAHMHDPAAITMGLKEKAYIEDHAHEYLAGRSGFEIGKSTPRELIPQLPEGCQGILLWGQRSIGERPLKTLEEARADHCRLVSMGYLAKDAPVRWFNPETRKYEEHPIEADSGK